MNAPVDFRQSPHLLKDAFTTIKAEKNLRAPTARRVAKTIEHGPEDSSEQIVRAVAGAHQRTTRPFQVAPAPVHRRATAEKMSATNAAFTSGWNSASTTG